MATYIRNRRAMLVAAMVVPCAVLFAIGPPNIAAREADDLSKLSQKQLVDRLGKAVENLAGAVADCQKLLAQAQACEDEARQPGRHPSTACPNRSTRGPGTGAGICRKCVDCAGPWKKYWDAVAKAQAADREYEALMKELMRRAEQK